jgi:hypothetical protein
VSSGTCRGDVPVSAYVAVPVVVGGWYAYDDTTWYGDPEPAYDDEPPPDDPSYDPGTVSDEPPPSDDGEGDITLSLRPRTYAGATGTGCFTCRIACTIQAPGGPPALSAVGSSTISYATACKNAQLVLTRYAQKTWSTTPSTCGHPAAVK